MNKYKVKILKRNKKIEVDVPGSKSITNRALLMASLSKGRTVLKNVLFSDDSRYFLQALEDLGFEIEVNEPDKTVIVFGTGGIIPRDNVVIYTGSAGTASRFLTAMLGLSGGSYTVNASEQMKKRPMKPLFQALEQLGVQFEYLEREYFLPVKILGKKEGKQKAVLDIETSSQPLSALLMTGPMLPELEICVTGKKKTGSYVDITRRMMSAFGCTTDFDGVSYFIRKGSSYQKEEYQIEPDVSAACYFYGIAALTGGSAIVRNVHTDTLQGDIQFTKVLEKMGCDVEETGQGIQVSAPKSGVLHGVTVDMNHFSDQALTLAALAVFADAPVKITNIGHIRLQECDRIQAISENMKRLGIRCDEGSSEITIYPGNTKTAEIETYEDHRVAMAFTLVGLGRKGITILNPMCCKKTFENYYEIIESLY